MSLSGVLVVRRHTSEDIGEEMALPVGHLAEVHISLPKKKAATFNELSVQIP